MHSPSFVGEPPADGILRHPEASAATHRDARNRFAVTERRLVLRAPYAGVAAAAGLPAVTAAITPVASASRRVGPVPVGACASGLSVVTVIVPSAGLSLGPGSPSHDITATTS
jgi:hypothetical protein